MKKFNLRISQEDYDSVQFKDGVILIEGIEVDGFMFPESMDSEDIATILSMEEDSDLESVLEYLKGRLKQQGKKFTFTIKSSYK